MTCEARHDRLDTGIHKAQRKHASITMGSGHLIDHKIPKARDYVSNSTTRSGFGEPPDSLAWVGAARLSSTLR